MVCACGDPNHFDLLQGSTTADYYAVCDAGSTGTRLPLALGLFLPVRVLFCIRLGATAVVLETSAQKGVNYRNKNQNRSLQPRTQNARATPLTERPTNPKPETKSYRGIPPIGTQFSLRQPHADRRSVMGTIVRTRIVNWLFEYEYHCP